MIKKAINIFYDKKNNFGNVLNPLLIERIFGIPCVAARKTQAEMVAVGSILQRFSTSSFISSTQKMFYPCLHIWSSGFIDDSKDTFFKRNVEIYALRGELSRQKCEKMLNKKLDVPLGEGGLLTSLLLDKLPGKKYALGIVPHLADSKNPTLLRLQEENKGSVLIDIARPSLEVLEQLAACECVASTSLQGLAVADSLGVPNKWIRVSNKIEGIDFKFKDYYSVFDIPATPLRLSTVDTESMRVIVRDILADYKVQHTMVSDIQKKLIKAFPFSKEG